jgi:hypothetical protein
LKGASPVRIRGSVMVCEESEPGCKVCTRPSYFMIKESVVLENKDSR